MYFSIDLWRLCGKQKEINSKRCRWRLNRLRKQQQRHITAMVRPPWAAAEREVVLPLKRRRCTSPPCTCVWSAVESFCGRCRDATKPERQNTNIYMFAQRKNKDIRQLEQRLRCIKGLTICFLSHINKYKYTFNTHAMIYWKNYLIGQFFVSWLFTKSWVEQSGFLLF